MKISIGQQKTAELTKRRTSLENVLPWVVQKVSRFNRLPWNARVAISSALALLLALVLLNLIFLPGNHAVHGSINFDSITMPIKVNQQPCCDDTLTPLGTLTGKERRHQDSMVVAFDKWGNIFVRQTHRDKNVPEPWREITRKELVHLSRDLHFAPPD